MRFPALGVVKSRNKRQKEAVLSFEGVENKVASHLSESLRQGVNGLGDLSKFSIPGFMMSV